MVYPRRYFTNSFVGNDSNDGLTLDAPKKTIEATCRALRKTRKELGCQIDKYGVYIQGRACFDSAGNLHKINIAIIDYATPAKKETNELLEEEW